MALELVASTYDVPAAAIAAESRGRGPRPPEAVRTPKKLALFLAASLANCDYAVLARHVRLHKDTVTTHCAWVRDACSADEDFERLIDVLGSAAIVRLEISGVRANEEPPQVGPTPRALARARLAHLEAFMAQVFEDAAKSLSDEARIFIRPAQPASSDAAENHPNVITLSRRVAR